MTKALNIVQLERFIHDVDFQIESFKHDLKETLPSDNRHDILLRCLVDLSTYRGYLKDLYYMNGMDQVKDS